MSTLKYSLYVLLGACSYGLLSVLVKLAYQEGFKIDEVIGSQYLFGFFFILIPFIFLKKKVTLKEGVMLAIAGTTTSLTGLLYAKSLETIPASIAIVLLFQFTWIGIVLDIIISRKWPDKEKLISVVILFLGTILASGGLTNKLFMYEISGIIYGLLSAVSFALFIVFSGRVAVTQTSIVRSFFMSTGALLFVLLLFSPDFMFNGSLGEGLWVYGALLGFFGVLLPVLLFSIGTPKIGGGLATIIGAAELPTAVIASALILNEHVSFIQVIGVIIILIGVAFPQLQYMKAKGRKPANL
ncbi:EamA family transporter [Bacillus weihaiensis]|uniref:Multidrug transporter n=1 Tax=Bacillus weihaiensis TaxID=1547283 RepID=A0A1L3MN34_9BACI|nr:DMT family transporter [Bacillus weihaiensis]APH03758.1 multidrug transporter [Bacillus weihaiensis]